MQDMLLYSGLSVLAASSQVSAIPLGRLAKIRNKLGISEKQLMGGLTIIGSGSYCVSLALLGVNPLWGAVSAVTLGGLYAGSTTIRESGKSLAGESRGGSPVATAFTKGGTRSLWSLRMAFSGLMLAGIGAAAFAPSASLVTPLAMVGVAGLTARKVKRFISDKGAVSNQIHEKELLRFYSWVEKNRVDTVIHLQNDKKATLSALDKAMAQLGKLGMKPGIICRGKKAFTVAGAKYENTWLSRSIIDLDDFCKAPVQRVVHLPDSPNSLHMVSLQHLTHVYLDLSGSVVSQDRIPNEIRMFDEIWHNHDVSEGITSMASDFGITLKSLIPKAPVVHQINYKEIFPLPRVPAGPKPVIGLIFPDSASDIEAALSKITEAWDNFVPCLEVVADHFDGNYQLLVSFGESTQKIANEAILSAMRGAYGKERVVEVKSPVDLLNRSQNILDGQWTSLWHNFAARRNILPMDPALLQSALEAQFCANPEIDDAREEF